MAIVQSPIIGNALRRVLGLDAAGGMPMLADNTIVPVAIVADVQSLVTDSMIPVMHYSFQAAVAGEYSYSVLEWAANAAPRPSRILLDRITIWSGVAQSVVLGYSGALAGSQDGLPRRKVGSLQSSSVAGRLLRATSANTAGVSGVLQGGLLQLVANVPLVFDFETPVILDQPNQFFAVYCNTVNASLGATFEWREERPS